MSQTTENTEKIVPIAPEDFKTSATQAWCMITGRAPSTPSSEGSDDEQASPPTSDFVSLDTSYLNSDFDDSDENTPLVMVERPPFDPNASCGSQQLAEGDTTPVSVVVAAVLTNEEIRAEQGPKAAVSADPPFAETVLKPPPSVDALAMFLKMADVRSQTYAAAVVSGQKQAGHDVKPEKVINKAPVTEVKPGVVPKPIFEWCKSVKPEILSKLTKAGHNTPARREIAAQIIEMHAREAGASDAQRQMVREKQEDAREDHDMAREAEKPRVVMKWTFGPGDAVPAEMLATCETYREVQRNIDACLERNGLIKNVGGAERTTIFRMPLLFTWVPHLWAVMCAILAVALVAARITSGIDQLWWLAYLACCMVAFVGKALVWWPDDRDKSVTSRGDYIALLRQRNAFGLLLMALSAGFPLCTFISGIIYLSALNEYSHWSALIWAIKHLTPLLFSVCMCVVCVLNFRNTLLRYCATEFEIEKQVRIMHTVDYTQSESGPPSKIKVTHSWKIRDDRSEEAKMQDLAIPYCHVGTYLMRCVLAAEVQLPVEGTAAADCATNTKNDHVQGWLLEALQLSLSLLTNTVEQSHSYHLEWLLQCISARSSSALLNLETRMAKIDMMAQTFNKVNWPTYTRLGVQSAPLGTNALAAFIIESSLHLLRQTHAGGFTPRASSHGVAN